MITYGSGPVDVNNINRQCPNPLRMAPVYNTEACTTLLYTMQSPNVLQIAPSGVMYILTKDSIPYKKKLCMVVTTEDSLV